MRQRIRLGFVSSALALAFVTAGCGGPALPRASAPAMPTEQAKCKIAAGQENPLVTEWPASEKANLESRLREGSVVVSYSGCSMKLLPQCRVKGTYEWKRTTISTDTIEIRNEDELYSKLPLGAVSLEGELQRSGRIAVQTTVGGQRILTGHALSEVPADGACGEATHVMGALSIGAFKLRSGGALSARAGVDVATLGGGSGGTRSEETVMRESGDPEACKASTDKDPDIQCSSPIQVFLMPLPRTLAAKGPAGMVQVNFSASGGKPWDVRVGERVVCRTPCRNFFDPATSFNMSWDPGFFGGGQENLVEVPDLRAYGTEGPIDVKASGRSLGAFAGGAVMTTFGGLGTAAGAALIPIGFATGETGIGVAGLIVLPLSVGGLLIPGIYFISNSGPEVTVTSPSVGPAARRIPQTTFSLRGAF